MLKSSDIFSIFHPVLLHLSRTALIYLFFFKPFPSCSALNCSGILLMQWPPLVEVVDTWELPSVLIERYNASGGEGTALCGIFPEIRRAWASVDNTLFMWRFDKW